MEWRKKKRYGDQKSKQNNQQQQVKCSITTTAAIAELIGQTSKKAQGASASATAGQFRGFASPAGWLAQLVQLLFYFDCWEKCGWWKIFSGYIASIFFFPFFQENDLKVTENIPENVG